MAFRDMAAEVRGWIPKMNLPLSETLVNRGLKKVYDESSWSFQLGTGGFSSPAEVAAGTITAVFGSNQVVGDSVASTAWAAIPAGYPITFFQIRLPAYNLYSVVKSQTTAGITTLTLDRPWVEPAGALLSYQLYQAYYAAPVQDFKRWVTVRDFTNANNIDFWSKKQDDLAADDPQRQVFETPSNLVPYQTDTRANSSTLGYMLFELWPHPLSILPYATVYLRSGPQLVNPSDTLLLPLSEELVLHRTKSLAYEWAEANKGRYPELQESDWKFLAKMADSEYRERLKDTRKLDRDLVDQFVKKIRRQLGGSDNFYSAITNQANVGNFGG